MCQELGTGMWVLLNLGSMKFNVHALVANCKSMLIYYLLSVKKDQERR